MSAAARMAPGSPLGRSGIPGNFMASPLPVAAGRSRTAARTRAAARTCPGVDPAVLLLGTVVAVRGNVVQELGRVLVGRGQIVEFLVLGDEFFLALDVVYVLRY